MIRGRVRPGLLKPTKLVVHESLSHLDPTVLPAELDLRKGRIWPPRDQGGEPSCTAYAAMACVELWHSKNKPAVPHYSAGFAYYFMRKNVTSTSNQEPMLARTAGYTRFLDAVAVLRQEGYCHAKVWDDRETDEPPEKLVMDAARNAIKDICYLSFPPGDERPKNLSALIYQELAGGRPVGAAVPGYARPGGRGFTNWTSAFENGLVQIPRPGDEVDIEAGHAVCVVGFTANGQSVKAVNDGFFILRNSFGEDFATAPTTGYPQGYGLIPAKLIDDCCWEMMLMRPPSTAKS